MIATSFARIHGQNLVNFGILPLSFCDPDEGEGIEPGTTLHIDDVHEAVRAREPFEVHDATADRTFRVRHELSERQIGVVLAGGLINAFRERRRG